MRCGNRNSLTIQDANQLGAHPGDVVLDDLGSCWRDIRLELREWRLRLRCDEGRLNFGKQLVGILATRQEMQSL